MSMHEKILILKRFQKARRRYLPVKYSFYEYVGGSKPLEPGWYEVRIGDAYLFIATDGTIGMARQKYHARKKGDYYANVGENGHYYHRHHPLDDASGRYRWWFVGEDIPPLQTKIMAS